MTVTIIGLPAEGLSKYFDKMIKNEEVETAIDITSQAKLTAPVDTGNYRQRIQHDKNISSANADYSVYLEYGTIKMQPFATMRTAAIEIAKRKGYKFE